MILNVKFSKKVSLIEKSISKKTLKKLQNSRKQSFMQLRNDLDVYLIERLSLSKFVPKKSSFKKKGKTFY
jgi:hypothetical protein